jgi:hypothetical protein
VGGKLSFDALNTVDLRTTLVKLIERRWIDLVAVRAQHRMRQRTLID